MTETTGDLCSPGKEGGSEVSEETEASADGSEVKEQPSSEPLLKRKKKRKTVSWVDESKLKTFHFFELDETERGGWHE